MNGANGIDGPDGANLVFSVRRVAPCSKMSGAKGVARGRGRFSGPGGRETVRETPAGASHGSAGRGK
jgi:hypothetical protein